MRLDTIEAASEHLRALVFLHIILFDEFTKEVSNPTLSLIVIN